MLTRCPGAPKRTAHCNDEYKANSRHSPVASFHHFRRCVRSSSRCKYRAVDDHDGSHLGTSTRGREPADDSNGNRRVQQQQAAELHQALANEWLEAIKAPPELCQPKVFVFVRHGHSTWNEQSRIQVSTEAPLMMLSTKVQQAADGQVSYGRVGVKEYHQIRSYLLSLLVLTWLCHIQLDC